MSPSLRRLARVVAVTTTILGISGGTAALAQDADDRRPRLTIWYWNSSDHDVKARFIHHGDTFQMCSHTNQDIYLLIDEYANGENIKRWEIDDNDIDPGECRKNVEGQEEGSRLAFKVCQEWNFGVPDDCSDWNFTLVK